MLATKQELIKKYTGKNFVAVMTLTNTAGVGIYELDDEAVFGALVVGDSYSYFLRKIYFTPEEDSRAYFKRGARRFYLNEFLRAW